jgi:DNA-binding CsgD family transcriptional regulator
MQNKMEDLASHTFEEIYEIIHIASCTHDRNLLRCRILDALFSSLYVESSVFFLPTSETQSTGSIEQNIDEKYVRQYKDYYHQYDPVQLIQGALCKKRVVQLEDLIDYHSFVSSSFYCDFLKPQKIHHKVYVNLFTSGRFQGRISLFRPVHARKFSEADIHTLKTISPYLAHALDHNDLYINSMIQGDILNALEMDLSTGLILLDDSMRPIYMNQKAKDFYRDLMGGTFFQDGSVHISSKLLEDCHAMAEEIKRCPAECLILPRHRVVQIKKTKKYHLCSRILEKGISSLDCRLYIISIEERNESKWIDQNRLKKIYHLTNREIDIVLHIFRGLKNVEIAQKLYVSEITVKKHVQHIFQKVGVKNRTALIGKILD